MLFFSVGNGEMNTPRDQCKYTTFSLRRDKFHGN
jgi:hypothetical protein